MPCTARTLKHTGAANGSALPAPSVSTPLTRGIAEHTRTASADGPDIMTCRDVTAVWLSATQGALHMFYAPSWTPWRRANACRPRLARRPGLGSARVPGW